MSEVTRLINAVDEGDPHAARQLLPLIYDELRKLAAQRLAQEKSGQTLQATALVHEAYLRLTNHDESVQWQGRGHFFAAAAEAMRRILIDNARRKQRIRHGGGQHRINLDELAATLGTDDQRAGQQDDELLALDEALTRLQAADAQAAQLVKLRFFAGLTMPQAAEALGISLRNAEREWTYARAWLHRALAAAD
jgi:RNA polymerase sigma factor (TIGR02999 family)